MPQGQPPPAKKKKEEKKNTRTCQVVLMKMYGSRCVFRKTAIFIRLAENLPNILWWSLWEKNLKENECVYMYTWIILLYSRNITTLQTNYTSVKLKKKRKICWKLTIARSFWRKLEIWVQCVDLKVISIQIAIKALGMRSLMKSCNRHRRNWHKQLCDLLTTRKCSLITFN